MSLFADGGASISIGIGLRQWNTRIVALGSFTVDGRAVGIPGPGSAEADMFAD